MKRQTQFFSALLILLVFGCTIWIAKEQLAERVREQALARQAEVLQAIALVHQVSMIEASGELSMENPADQLVVMGEISELSGALGFRLFSPESDYLYSYPETVTEGLLDAAKFQQAMTLNTSAELTERAIFSEWMITEEEATLGHTPIL